MRRSDRMPGWAVALVAVVVGVVVGRAPLERATAEMGRLLAGPTAVAVVDIARTLDQLAEKRDREMELESAIADRQARVDRLRDEAQAVAEELDILPEGSMEWRDRREEAIRLEGRLQIEQKLAQQILSQSRMRMQLELFNKIVESSQRYAEREGFDIVLSSDVSEPIPEVAAEQMGPQEFMAMLASRRVVHATDAVDITDEVAQMMNNEFQAP